MNILSKKGWTKNETCCIYDFGSCNAFGGDAGNSDGGDSVTYIWKALGKTVASEDSGFVDIEAGSECERAAAWAKEAGVTSGTSNTTFSPKKSVPERRSSHSYLRLLNSN